MRPHHRRLRRPRRRPCRGEPIKTAPRQINTWQPSPTWPILAGSSRSPSNASACGRRRSTKGSLRSVPAGCAISVGSANPAPPWLGSRNSSFVVGRSAPGNGEAAHARIEVEGAQSRRRRNRAPCRSRQGVRPAPAIVCAVVGRADQARDVSAMRMDHASISLPVAREVRWAGTAARSGAAGRTEPLDQQEGRCRNGAHDDRR